MVSVEKWAMWDSAVEVDVTEGAALPTAHALIAAAIDETEAVCDLRRGDAEIHAVNLAQGTPVKVTRRMSALLRSALWAARMTGGAVNPLADNYSEDESIPPVHPTPTFEDVQLDGDVVYAPWGASFDITGVAKADTVDRAAQIVAAELQCGVAVRIGDVIATAGHAPAGGWQIPVPDSEEVELINGTAMATARALELPSWEPNQERPSTEWAQVSVIADDAVWAYAASEAALTPGDKRHQNGLNSKSFALGSSTDPDACTQRKVGSARPPRESGPSALSAVPLHQSICGCVAEVAGCCFGRERARPQFQCLRLAEFDAPLIERIDTPDSTFDKYLVLVKRDQLTDDRGGQLLRQDSARRSVAWHHLVRHQLRSSAL